MRRKCGDSALCHCPLHATRLNGRLHFSAQCGQQRNRKTDDQKQKDETANPVRQRQNRHKNIDDLQQQSGDDQERYRNASLFESSAVLFSSCSDNGLGQFLREFRLSATRHKMSNISEAPTSAVFPLGSNGGATSTTSPPMRFSPRSPRSSC